MRNACPFKVRHEKGFWRIERRPCVYVVAKSRGLVCVVWQIRQCTKTMELPGGTVDVGETPIQAAKRELREETGLTARRWRRLGELHHLWFGTGTLIVFEATGVRPGPATSPDVLEIQRMEWVSWSDLRHSSRHDPVICAVLAWAQ